MSTIFRVVITNFLLLLVQKKFALRLLATSVPIARIFVGQNNYNVVRVHKLIGNSDNGYCCSSDKNYNVTSTTKYCCGCMKYKRC